MLAKPRPLPAQPRVTLKQLREAMLALSRAIYPDHATKPPRKSR